MVFANLRATRRFSGLLIHGLLLSFLHVSLTGAAQTPRSRLEVGNTNADGWIRIGSTNDAVLTHTLEASPDLRNWTNIAIIHDGPFEFADPFSTFLSRRFYRLTSRTRSPGDDSKNLLFFPEEPFLSLPTSWQSLRWVKFAIVTNDPNRVWFQDSAKFPFHYDYAVERLAPFRGMSRAQFDAVSLHRGNQQVVLGAVLFGPWTARNQFAIQFAGLDPYPVADVTNWFRLVQSAIYGAEPAEAFYFPTFEQFGAAAAQKAELAKAGVIVSSPDRWNRENACYSEGWALGRLVFIAGPEIGLAYRDGRLKPSDILVTDGVPAEIPYVSGILTLAPATANSHVAILARSYGVPFLYLADRTEAEKVRALEGQEVVVRAYATFAGCAVRIFPVSPSLNSADREEILKLLAPGRIRITPKKTLNALSRDTTGLTRQDLPYFGGKAANFGLLRRVIPTNSPKAIAFSFDLWDAFLDQTLPGSDHSLRQEIRDRLKPYSYPPNLAAVASELEGIRDLIKKRAVFNPNHRQAIITALAGFDAGRKIRFRSSTNVEDSEAFTGAGLYDSYSGCLADDLDSDSAGPSRCDSDENNERGVFRAIQQVYASFYNDNAWLERLRVGLSEDEVGMAVLVHHSFPDEQELANGVATVTYRNFGSPQFEADLVSQVGAISVANPADGTRPELVKGHRFFGLDYFETVESSNLLPLGGHVMNWEADYRTLFLNLLVPVTTEYAKSVPDERVFTLDFEYKKVSPGEMVVKQVRQIPNLDTGSKTQFFILNEPAEYCVFQGEAPGDLFALHRLKSRLSLQSRDVYFNPTNGPADLYTNSAIQFVAGTNVVVLSNGPAGWPGATHRREGTVVTDEWVVSTSGANTRYELETSIEPGPEAGSSVVMTLRDFRKTLRATYAQPIPGDPPIGSESVNLVECPVVSAESLLQNRVLTNRNGVRIETEFYWPPPPTGVVAGYTAPLEGWVETRIYGLTSEPIKLHGYYSQTYKPGHHNFQEEFLFEPGLESGLNENQRAELAANNIRAIYALRAVDESQTIELFGFDRPLRGTGSPLNPGLFNKASRGF